MAGNRQLTAVLAGLICLAGAGGCSRPSAMSIASPAASLPAGENSAEYLDRIASQPVVCENDAMRGILLLLKGKDQAKSFDQRVRLLMAEKIVPAGWQFRGEKPITRGKLAYMTYQACRMSGGLILTLTGPSQRYCLRELQYRGLVSSGVTYSKVSGMEFVAILTRADSLLETGEVPEVLSTSQGK